MKKVTHSFAKVKRRKRNSFKKAMTIIYGEK